MRLTYFRIILGILLYGITAPLLAAPTAIPKVLTTIKPLQLIATSVTAGVSQPDVLLPLGASPHDFAMRPSDAVKLQQADVILWVGPELETFLRSALKKYAGNAERITATHLPGIHLLHQGATQEDNPTSHTSINPHIWLDPDNALLMAQALRDRLCTQDAAHCAIYKKNTQHFQQAIDELRSTHKAKLSTGFFVYHRAWDYLARAYQLSIIDAFTIDPDFLPGAAHIVTLRSEMEKAAPACLLVEPQFQPALIHRVTQGLEIHQAAVDPLAGDVSLSRDGYVQFISGLLTTITHCVTQTVH